MLINPNEIKIDKIWSNHIKKIYYFDNYIGYIRNATGNRVEACSRYSDKFGNYPTGESMNGHESSEIIAAVDLLDRLINRMHRIIDDRGNKITF